MKTTLSIALIIAAAMPHLHAGTAPDYDTADPSLVAWASDQGVRIWDAEKRASMGFLGKADSARWSGTPFEWIVGSTQLIYGTDEGLRIWDAATNSEVGPYGNVTSGNWHGAFDIALHPTDPDLILWTSSTGIRTWDTDTNQDAGVFNSADGDWSGYGIANHPSNPNFILYPGENGRINIWDTVVNVRVGTYGQDVDSGWSKEFQVSAAPLRRPLPGFPLTLVRDGETVTLSWPAEVGAVYQIQTGTQLWDFRDKGAPFMATGDPMETSLAASGSTEFFRVCKVFGPSDGLAPSPDDFAAAIVGQTLFDEYQIASATRFTWLGEPGNWTYVKTGLDTGVMVFTYDEDGNNPAVYREEVVLTFTGEGTGAFAYAEYELDALVPGSAFEDVPFSFN